MARLAESVCVWALRYSGMTELTSQVGSTRRGSFGNVLENLSVHSVRCSKMRALNQILSHVQMEQGGARAVEPHSVLI